MRDPKVRKFATVKFKVNVYGLNPGIWRTGAAPFYCSVDAFFVAFKDCFDAAICKVANPSRQSIS